ncbi:DUF6438 domain-containing protein [Flavobacterium sp. RHBU_24]|uniref:DUF6438 domain-containing protein n=1 Tax=Flavobacterium sp. RHBU_24 TaxID=3391185 RepID=UPI003984F2CF
MKGQLLKVKTLLLFIVNILLNPVVYAQKLNVDNVTSERLAEKFIHRIDKDYESFKIRKIASFTNYHRETKKSCKYIADSLGITESFYKADFDRNGLTDLLVTGEFGDFAVLVALNQGKNSFKIKQLTRRSFQDCVFPKILNDSVIRYYYLSENYGLDKEEAGLLFKDLILKFNDFVEFNPSPKKHDIEKIEYQTSMCYGICPKFYIKINKNRAAIFKAEKYNVENWKSKPSKSISGTFSGEIDEKSFSDIVSLLDYIDFPNLKDSYSVNWTDDQTCTLKVTYNNGTVKEIKDYGLVGTSGLNRLYQLFFELRFNQKWNED